MHGLSSHSVVDQIVTELGERRRTAYGRRAAYQALACAIVFFNDDSSQGSVTPDFEREFTASAHAPRAA